VEAVLPRGRWLEPRRGAGVGDVKVLLELAREWWPWLLRAVLVREGADEPVPVPEPEPLEDLRDCGRVSVCLGRDGVLRGGGRTNLRPGLEHDAASDGARSRVAREVAVGGE
jgi:hypothetical protein